MCCLGFGCDTKVVVHILAHRDATQRAFIQQEYRAMYGDEITHRLSSELGGDLKVKENPIILRFGTMLNAYDPNFDRSIIYIPIC